MCYRTLTMAGRFPLIVWMHSYGCGAPAFVGRRLSLRGPRLRPATTSIVILVLSVNTIEMGFPDFTPPTDNLYKFLAITGLLIIGWTSAALVYLDYRVKDLAVVSAALSDDAIAKLRIAREEEDSARQLPSNSPPGQEIEQASKQDAIQANRLMAGSSEASQRVLDANADYIWAVHHSPIAFLVGGVFIVFGFAAWLFLVQLKEDKLTDLKIARTQIELDSLCKKSGVPLK
jgi:hypothetical protein